MRHSFETPINDNTQLIMEGTMAARQGAGGANVSGTIKHQFSPRFWAQYTQTFLAPLIGSVKGTYTIDDNTYLTGNAVVQTFAAPPRMTLTLGRRLYAETTGFISEWFRGSSLTISIQDRLLRIGTVGRFHRATACHG